MCESEQEPCFQTHDLALPRSPFLSLHSSTHISHCSPSILLSLLLSDPPFIPASFDPAPSHPSIICPSLSPWHYSLTSSLPLLPPPPLLLPSDSPSIPSIWRIVQRQHLSRRPISKEQQYRGTRQATIHPHTHTHTALCDPPFTVMAQQIYYTPIQYKAVPLPNIASLCLALSLSICFSLALSLSGYFMTMLHLQSCNQPKKQQQTKNPFPFRCKDIVLTLECLRVCAMLTSTD